MLRESVRDFSQKKYRRRAAEIDRSNQFPPDLWRKMGSLGLLGVTVEGEYGGTAMAPRPHRGDGGDFGAASASIGLSYWRPTPNLCGQPDPPQRLRGAEEEVPAQARLRRARRRPSP